MSLESSIIWTKCSATALSLQNHWKFSGFAGPIIIKHVESWGNNFFLKLRFLTFGQRHSPDFSRKENSKSSQIHMFPDVSRKNLKIWKFPDFSRVLRTLKYNILLQNTLNLIRFSFSFYDIYFLKMFYCKVLNI